MSWWAVRAGKALGALTAGGAAGTLVGGFAGWPVAGCLLGGAVGIVTAVGVDAARGERLLTWLRGAHDAQAPRDAGIWGELGYRVERALRQRERSISEERQQLSQFLSAIEASPNGVLMLDADEHIDWCNSVAADHFGLDPQRDRLQRVTNLVRSPAFKAYLTAGEFDEPVSFPAPKGQGLLSVMVRPYGDGRKLVLSQDIAERERAEAMRRDFVANVSHELRTPLTVLAGFVETMSSLPLSDAERRRVMSLMEQQTDRMQNLVADLLTLSQLEGSPRPATDHWVGVAELMQRAEADARALSAGRHAVAFQMRAPAEIAGAETELYSALGNLVSNAVRYTPTDGRIDVTWSMRPDGSGVFEVADSGIGVPREHIPRLTERFYRVDGSRSRETGGTGLGLSIVKHVMQRHGGAIEVDSEPGRGSRFRLVFPPARVRRSSPVRDASAAALP
jgi:two-component system phosphate regulon sensor histidine kinase PhoR